ncbi:Na(+)-translocating NADH-quinone reductase subunit A [Bacteroidota bacterium]
MGLTKIKKGLTLPITGAPEQVIKEVKKPQQVALIGYDYIGMKPTMLVQVGDMVKLGQVLFTDKKLPGVKYTSPGTGKVIEINRGKKRVFESLVIQLEGNDEITFKSYSDDELKLIDRETIIEQLIESGIWTSLRQRPFSKVADPESMPHSIFVTAIDTNPHAPSMEIVLERKEKAFEKGLKILSKLTEGKLFLCKAPDAKIPVAGVTNISTEIFEGPHPAGNVGTHIHFIDPVGKEKTVWYINAQDVVAIGTLFKTGKIDVERIVSLAGPGVKEPRLITTQMGAALGDLTADELKDDKHRIISGSPFNGRTANGPVAYLGRYHQQIFALHEGNEKVLFGWLNMGPSRYSIKKIVLGSLFPKKKFDLDTAIHGGHRAIVPIGSYEKVMPLDILPTYLLKALAVDDIEDSENLGCLELDEEDLALCSMVCPSKIDHGVNLRRVLNLIEKEG